MFIITTDFFFFSSKVFLRTMKKILNLSTVLVEISVFGFTSLIPLHDYFESNSLSLSYIDMSKITFVILNFKSRSFNFLKKFKPLILSFIEKNFSREFLLSNRTRDLQSTNSIHYNIRYDAVLRIPFGSKAFIPNE